MEEGRFATETSLAAFARRLRALGYDVLVFPGATLERVCEAAAAHDRILLTLSERVPRACVRTRRCVIVRGQEPAALKAIVSEWAAGTKAFGRCTRCNAPLAVPEDAALFAGAPVPPPRGVRVTGQCPACRRCYWHGSHVEALRVMLGAVLGSDPAAPTAGS